MKKTNMICVSKYFCDAMKRFILRRGIFFMLLSVMACEMNAPLKKDPTPSAEDVDAGEMLYLAHGCAVCHGAEGRGDGLTAGRFYPPPTNFYDVSTYRYGSDVASIKAIIQKGVPGSESAMPAFDHLTKKELSQLAAFIYSMLQSVDKNKETIDDVP